MLLFPYVLKTINNPKQRLYKNKLCKAIRKKGTLKNEDGSNAPVRACRPRPG